MDLASARRRWDVDDVDSVWLNTAQYGIPPRTAVTALTEAMRVWRTGSEGPQAWGRAGEIARHHFAALVGAPVEGITQGATTAQLLGTVAASLPEGARVVVPEGDYTSAVFPWRAQADRGVEVVAVPLDKLADAVDARTSIVAFSLVQSATGELAPVNEVLAAAHAVDAWTAVDATQAAGWLPLDATRFDMVAVSAYKWLMAPRGLAYGYLSPRLRAATRPLNAGPTAAEDPMASFYSTEMHLSPTASRFDLSPAWFACVGAAASLGTLREIGVDTVHKHNVALANRFLTGLGLPPGDSAIVTVERPNAGERLRAAGVHAAERAGRARLSFHVYTTEDDTDRAVAALR
ncbi:aminotransferase class V-fold PLP-dependent enzyme [Salinactinospora qingdaonensis]|uniref:Aminotransferase class V-fold PLP-dependent enzyme n=1 Tax=Salinactinospora qingdaonensis TaxID=702744 RepID=A0ABP7FGV5_9ACTN